MKQRKTTRIWRSPSHERHQRYANLRVIRARNGVGRPQAERTVTVMRTDLVAI